MWFSRLTFRLFAVYAVLNLGLAIGYVCFVAHWQRDLVMEQVEKRLHDTAFVLRSQFAGLLGRDDRDRLRSLTNYLGAETGIRITVVDGRGVVLADSLENPDTMDDHYDREELQQARLQGWGTSQRYSRTMRLRMLYYSLRIEVPGAGAEEAFVRVSLPLQSIDQQVSALHWYLWTLASIVGFIALVSTLLASGRVMRPLSHLKEAAESVAAGNYNQKIPVDGNDEVGQLAQAVNRMRRALVKQLTELQQNSLRLETVLSSMVEGVLAVDADHRVLLANAAAKSMLLIETREIVGRPLLEVTRNRSVREALEKAFQRDDPYESEFETSGINRRYLALRAARLAGDPCPGAVAVLYDITDLRQLENIRREFVANVSHELKTPLASIKAYAETLRMGAIHDQEHNIPFLERIEEQADRLHQLIQDLLQLARVESGKEAFEIRDVSLGNLIDQCEPVYYGRAQAKNLELQIDPAAGPVIARADVSGLTTILDNLVANAIQYTPAGGLVTIRYRADDGRAVLEVEDTGVGIAPRDQARIFERFYRVDKARSRELGGTGLGLAIVKHLTQAFGGEVSVSSEPGTGSTFQVRLPLSA
jgi:two-component system phosphate regulon sensor histidine kinase PhoR